VLSKRAGATGTWSEGAERQQCVKRVCSFEHREAWGDLTNASVPAGTLVPAGGRRDFDNLAAKALSVNAAE